MNLDSPDTPRAATAAEAPRRARGRPRKTAGERDDGNRRQELINGAARLFRQQGFAATSTRDIAAAVGMRSGSPFYHFESKEALLGAVMLEGMQGALLRQHAALALLPPEAPARERLRVLVRNHFDALLGPDSDFIPVMLYEWRSLDATQRSEVNRLKDRYEADWVPVLAALHAQGQLGSDPVLARLMIFGALNWSAQWYAPPSGRSAKSRARASLDDLTTSALQLFLKEPA
ncbi:TetR family transcriptional regulator [Hydrogenophaga sp. Root209]|uniref:TetR/AcrR family transcriptional regulator n=1 Tax=unclassified Hydrogenophaga TaxID=2610897 RepID=UPI0006FC25F3|nr:TetR/AcrR family transcriptional regulator [Hydrogenophaga sp. Root209]KRC04328.1 TetR family transcriptional regulator [Hydrogenophaga sp. Root209]